MTKKKAKKKSVRGNKKSAKAYATHRGENIILIASQPTPRIGSSQPDDYLKAYLAYKALEKEYIGIRELQVKPTLWTRIWNWIRGK